MLANAENARGVGAPHCACALRVELRPCPLAAALEMRGCGIGRMRLRMRLIAFVPSLHRAATGPRTTVCTAPPHVCARCTWTVEVLAVHLAGLT